MRFFVVVAVISAITLAASSPIYSGAYGSHVTGHTSASPVAPARPTVSGPCSRAVANRLLKQLHLGPNWPEPNPAGQVLCGAFTGPRSQSMAVTFRLGVCMPTFGWGVFRFAAGTWKLVMTRNGYSTLAAVGTDIRETVPIYRRGDRRCFPSGGTHDRIWHWNGRRFTHSGWAASKTVHLDDFLSPDRKVWCRIFTDTHYAWCVISPGTSPPSDHSAEVHPDGGVKFCSGYCTQNWDSSAPLLRYGQQSEVDGFRCTSETKGITCTVIAGTGQGRGFLINAAGVTKVG